MVPKTCNLAGLLPPLWRSDEPLDDLGAPGSTKKETLWLMLVSISDGFRDFMFYLFSDFGPANVLFPMLISRLLVKRLLRLIMDIWIWRYRYSKSQLFTGIGNLIVPGSSFYVF